MATGGKLIYTRHVKDDACNHQSVQDNIQTIAASETIENTVQDPQPRVTDQISAQAIPSPTMLTLVKTLDLVKAEGDAKKPWVTGLDFLADGRIAAVDFNNKTCFILNTDLQRLGSAYRFQQLPYDVTCYGENKLAVALWYVFQLQ